MKHIGVKVDPIWPRDRARNWIDRHLREVGRFHKLVEATVTEDIFKVELPDQTGREGQPKTEASRMFNLSNPRQ